MPLFNERAFIAEVESAGTADLIKLLVRPTRHEERALRIHLGDAVYERLHSLATRSSATRSGEKQGNVVVTHGIMGGELTRTKENGRPEALWIHVLRILLGGMGWLRLNPEGRDIAPVQATGILKKYYGPMLLSLAAEWNVHAFWYDWRKDLAVSADKLRAEIEGRFGKGQPVHIVAHSMGGLVARTFILKNKDMWERMWDEKGSGARGGRLVMLGTPNHGSFAITKVMTGAMSVVRKLAMVDFKNNLPEILGVLNTFPGSYQMLPSPLVMPEMDDLYKASTYDSRLGVSQRHLTAARRHHQALAPIIDPERMIYVAGFNQPTHDDVLDRWQLGSLSAYRGTLRGDGTVPHRLGFLKGVPNYFVEAEHGNLPADQRVIDAVWQLLPSGKCDLAQTVPAGLRGAAEDARAADEAGQAVRAREEIEVERARLLAQRLRGKARGHEAGLDDSLSGAERELERLLLAGFAGDGSSQPGVDAQIEETTAATGGEAATTGREPASQRRRRKLRIEIAVAHGGIQEVDKLVSGERAVDAIAVGHYVGVKPQYAEYELDRAISAALLEGNAQAEEGDLVITQLTERGIIRGELGQPFFLQDPRPSGAQRILAMAGMGLPGRFGKAELTVLVHELCWSLGRLGKRHLATVLIGAGAGNIPHAQAVHAWLQGIRRAITGSREDAVRRLARVTFVENDAANIAAIHDGIAAAREGLANQDAEEEEEIEFVYQPLTPAERADLSEKSRRAALAKLEEDAKLQRRQIDKGIAPATEEDPIAVRLTVGQSRDTFQFAAITATASVPQRDIAVDPALIMEINQEAASAEEPGQRSSRGRLLERLLIPADIRETIYGDAPIVLMLDSTTARIHWELLARDTADLRAPAAGAAAQAAAGPRLFLGTSYGLTRQLRTTFAPPPEPPPPPRRTLRVLVVADPADDAPLPGAQTEGEQVAALFRLFNTLYAGTENRVEVTTLIGPYQATRVNVMDELFNRRPYDVLHFAGHCIFDSANPANSGWIFSGGQRLSANELSRVDRVPKFVFSNACESGITPDRTDLRSAGLAPSFAEAFFARGVANFVCTAWPVNDEAALHFAVRLYLGLLGIATVRDSEPVQFFATRDFEPMHHAMQEARLAITENAEGRSWAAYQHYGNPFFRIFDRSIFRTPRASAPAPPSPAEPPRAKKSAPRKRATAAKPAAKRKEPR